LQATQAKTQTKGCRHRITPDVEYGDKLVHLALEIDRAMCELAPAGWRGDDKWEKQVFLPLLVFPKTKLSHKPPLLVPVFQQVNFSPKALMVLSSQSITQVLFRLRRGTGAVGRKDTTAAFLRRIGLYALAPPRNLQPKPPLLVPVCQQVNFSPTASNTP